MERIIQNYKDIHARYKARLIKNCNDKEAELIVDLTDKLIEVLDIVETAQTSEGEVVAIDKELQTIVVSLDNFDKLNLKVGAEVEISIEKL